MSITLVWLLSGICHTQAAQAVYTLSSVGSGSVGSHAFYMAPFTIASTADTSEITNSYPGIFYVPNITATISVPGVITATFTGPMANVINNTVPGKPGVGIGDPIQKLTMLADFTDSTLENYDLSTSIGPITGRGDCNPLNYFPTTVGFFSLRSISDVTFQAIVVPEPSIVALFGLGLIGAAYYQRRP